MIAKIKSTFGVKGFSLVVNGFCHPSQSIIMNNNKTFFAVL